MKCGIRMKRSIASTGLFLLILVVVLPAVFLFFSPSLCRAETGKPLSYDIDVITYNICGLPDFLTYRRGLAPTSRRFEYIGEELKKYDIIGLQEAFVSKRSIVEEILEGYYVVHGADIGRVQVLGSGVYTFSRWPVTKSHYEKWNFLDGNDRMSLKGFVAARVEVSRWLTVDVYNLHAQTGKDERKKDNNVQLHEFMKYFSYGSGNPILLIGDFNCKTGDEICGHLVEITGMKTADPGGTKVDHMFFDENGSGWNIEVLDSGFAFDTEIDGGMPSDHIALGAVFRFSKPAEGK